MKKVLLTFWFPHTLRQWFLCSSFSSSIFWTLMFCGAIFSDHFVSSLCAIVAGSLSLKLYFVGSCTRLISETFLGPGHHTSTFDHAHNQTPLSFPPILFFDVFFHCRLESCLGFLLVVSQLKNFRRSTRQDVFDNGRPHRLARGITKLFSPKPIAGPTSLPYCLHVDPA